MNRLDRLFATTTYLQGRSRVRAADLARVFEVSRRTVYRDIAALSEAGVPVVALPGAGYELASGFFLPPFVFSATEATALVLGARLLAGQTTGRTARAAERAVAKIAAILPEDARRQVEAQADAIRFVVPDGARSRLDPDDPRLVVLQQAIRERRVISLRYHGRNRDETTEREVEPHDLIYFDGAWYVRGHCRLRQAERSFRLERIERLEPVAETFVRRLVEPPERAPLEVRVRFAPRIARWVREQQHWSYVREEAAAEGLVAVYAPDELSEIDSWLLGWGTAAEVLALAELRRRLRDEAQALAEMLT